VNFGPRPLPEPQRNTGLWLAGRDDLYLANPSEELPPLLPSLSGGRRRQLMAGLSEAIASGDIATAVETARQQVDVTGGRCVLEIRVGDDRNDDNNVLPGLMKEFMKVAVADPIIARVPFVFSGSNTEATLVGLKYCRGKCCVVLRERDIFGNDAQEGDDDDFAARTMTTPIKRLGAAVAVLVDDSTTTPDDDPDCQTAVVAPTTTITEESAVFGRKKRRLLDALANRVGFPSKDIVVLRVSSSSV